MNNVDSILNYLNQLIPDPKCELNYTTDFELLIAIMLSAQTTDKRVNIVTKELFSKYDTIEKLSSANLNDIESIIKSLGNYTKKSKAIIDIANQINKWGYVPKNRKKLESLPMIGRKTVNVFLSEYHNIPNIAVDTHVERVSKRLKLTRDKASVLEIERSLKRKIPKDLWNQFHLRMVHFGRYYCTAKNPKCDACKLKSICNYYKKK